MELMRIKQLLLPAAWTLVGAQGLLLIALVSPLVLRHGFEFDAGPAWLAALLAFVVGLAVGWADAGRRARPVAIAALVVNVSGIAVLLALGVVSLGVILSVATVPGEVVAQVLLVGSALAVAVLATVALLRLLPLTAAAQAGTTPALPAVPEPEAQTGRAPVWQPDRAAGVAWHTAGEAATGAAAVDWGRPGERGDWTAAGHPQGVGSSTAAPSRERLPERAEGAQPRPPVDFGPRAQPPAGGDAAAASGTSVDFGSQAIAGRPADNDEGLSRPAPPGSPRQPPRWIPLEDPTQPPPQP